MREVREKEAVLEEKSQEARKPAMPGERKEKVSTRAVQMEPSFSDEDSEAETD